MRQNLQPLVPLSTWVHILPVLFALACSSPDRGGKRTNHSPGDTGATNVDRTEPNNQPQDGQNKEGPIPQQNDDVPPSGPPPAFALRSFNRLNATMASLTGVGMLPTATVPLTTQDALNTMLPGETRITGFQSGSQFATYKLASEYCNLMVDREAATPKILTRINLKNPPPAVFTETGKKDVVTTFTNRFWVLPPENLLDAQNQLVQMVTDLMSGKTLTTAVQTTAIVKAVCTAVLASAPVTFY